MRYLSILIIVLQLNSALADNCTKPVTALKKGDSSPCDGFLFSKPKEAEVKKKVQDLDLANQQISVQASQLGLYKNQSDLYKSVATDSEKRAELYRNSALDATDKLVKEDNSRGYKDFLMFAAGFGAAVAAALIVKNSVK